MIVTRLDGGLGNQMFQYAAGLRLACARRTELKLDLSRLGRRDCATPRSFALAPLCVSAQRASEAELRALSARPWRERLAWRRRRAGASPAVERHFHFDPEVLALPDGSHLRGYWQSERYFEEVADRVRRDLSPREPASGRDAELAEEIAACCAVGLHVRRGDYVSDAATHAVHGTCSVDYYRRAVAHLAEKLPDLHLFLFGDDPEWTREALRFDHPTTLVDHNGPEACHRDLWLLSRCAHHVIANSSFSWWAAWLGRSPEQVVVAPERWFRDGGRDTRDLLPPAWVRL